MKKLTLILAGLIILPIGLTSWATQPTGIDTASSPLSFKPLFAQGVCAEQDDVCLQDTDCCPGLICDIGQAALEGTCQPQDCLNGCGIISGVKYHDINGDGLRYIDTENPSNSEPGLTDWVIQLKTLIAEFEVSSDGTIATSPTLEAGQDYLIRVEGTYTAGDSITADAKYSVRAPNTTWSDSVQNYESYGPELLDLQIDGASPNWGSFDPGHNYQLAYTGDGSNLDFQINDLYYPNNSGVLNVQIYLLKQTITGPDGSYSFTHLPWGEYIVSEQLQAGWVQTQPFGNGWYVVTFSQGDEVANNVNFGNFQLAKIGGIKYEDINGNGRRDSNEPGLEDWTINLEGPLGLQSAQTGPDGSYNFSQLGPGIYVLSEVPQTDWYQSEPSLRFGDGLHVIAPESGEVIQDANFGNYRLGQIKGRKYQDLNFNDQRDRREPWLKGWTIELINLSTGEKMTTVTNRQGKYSFIDLAPGKYFVKEKLQDGWMAVNPKSTFHSVQLNSNQILTGIDFGNNTIENYKEHMIPPTSFVPPRFPEFPPITTDPVVPIIPPFPEFPPTTNNPLATDGGEALNNNSQPDHLPTITDFNPNPPNIPTQPSLDLGRGIVPLNDRISRFRPTR